MAADCRQTARGNSPGKGLRWSWIHILKEKSSVVICAMRSEIEKNTMYKQERGTKATSREKHATTGNCDTLLCNDGLIANEKSFCKQNTVTGRRKFQKGIYLTKPFERRGLCLEYSEVKTAAQQPHATLRLGTALTAAAGFTSNTTEPRREAEQNRSRAPPRQKCCAPSAPTNPRTAPVPAQPYRRHSNARRYRKEKAGSPAHSLLPGPVPRSPAATHPHGATTRPTHSATAAGRSARVRQPLARAVATYRGRDEDTRISRDLKRTGRGEAHGDAVARGGAARGRRYYGVAGGGRLGLLLPRGCAARSPSGSRSRSRPQS